MTVEGLPGRRYEIDFFTDRAAASVPEGTRIAATPRGFRLEMEAPRDAPVLASGFARWEVALPLPAPPVRGGSRTGEKSGEKTGGGRTDGGR